MDKILVELFVPILNRNYDIYISNQCSIGDVIELVKLILYDDSKDEYFKSNDLMLYLVGNDENLDYDMSPVTSFLKNGSQIILL